MLVKGKDLVLYANMDGERDEMLALSKSCTLDITSDIIEVASTKVGRDKQFIAGKRSWQVTSESLVAVNDEQLKKLISCQEEGKEIEVIFGSRLLFVKYGKALIQSISLSGAVGSLATYNITLIGSGPLETI